MKVGADECETLNRELKTLNRKVGDQRHELKKSKKKLDVALGEVQDHLAIKLKLDKELTAAKETETKLKKQIDELLKSVPAVSKPVIQSLGIPDVAKLQLSLLWSMMKRKGYAEQLRKLTNVVLKN